MFDLATEMSFEEKRTWIYAVVSAAAYGVYLAIILGRGQGMPLAQVPYVVTMLECIGGAVAASVAGVVVLSIVWPKDANKKDQRDRQISRFGDHIGQSFIAIGAVAALVLSMAQVEHFWIANAIYLACTLSALLGSAAKVVAYRRGFQSW